MLVYVPDRDTTSAMAHHPVFQALPGYWPAEQKVKSKRIQIRDVHIHGNRRTRRYLIDRELLRCELAEDLGQLEEQLEEAVEALLELGVFIAVDAFIDEASEVSIHSPDLQGLDPLVLHLTEQCSQQGGPGAVNIHLTVSEQGPLGLNIATYAQGQGGKSLDILSYIA